MRDQIENYNIHHSIFSQQHPKALQPFLSEMRAFTEHNHYNVLHPILWSVPIVTDISDVPLMRKPGTSLLALGLELPEDAFTDMFDFDAAGETYGSCSSYPFYHH